MWCDCVCIRARARINSRRLLSLFSLFTCRAWASLAVAVARLWAPPVLAEQTGSRATTSTSDDRALCPIFHRSLHKCQLRMDWECPGAPPSRPLSRRGSSQSLSRACLFIFDDPERLLFGGRRRCHKDNEQEARDRGWGQDQPKKKKKV